MKKMKIYISGKITGLKKKSYKEIFMLWNVKKFTYIWTMKKRALKLIEKNSKVWLASKLELSRPTLDKRIKFDNWKKPEIQMLLILDR